MSTSQAKHISQVVDQQQARFHFVLVADTVDTYVDSLSHSYLTFLDVLTERRNSAGVSDWRSMSLRNESQWPLERV
jgi:hypothetical protein